MTPRSRGTRSSPTAPALIAAFLEPDVARTIFADRAHHRRLGAAQRHARLRRRGRLSRHAARWDFASGCRHANWMGAHCHVVEADGSLRLNRFGRPVIRTLPVSRRAGDPDRHLEHHRPARHGVRQLSRRRIVFVPEAFSTTREEPELRRERGPLYAFTMQGLYAVGAAGVALGIARAMLDEFIALAIRKTPRALSRLADNAVVQADVARAEARLGAARAYLLDTLASIYARADDIDADRHCRPRAGAARLHQCHPRRHRGGRLHLQGRRRRRDLPGQPVRAPLPRHPHAVAADPVAHRPLRGRRPDPARHAAGGVLLGARYR